MTDDSRRDRELIAAYLAGRDVACPTCRYSLRDCPEPICPECGSRIALTVENTAHRTRPYVVGLVSLFGLFSHHVWSFGYTAHHLLTPPTGMIGQPATNEVLVLARPLVSLALVTSWILQRHRMCTSRRRTQWWFATAAILVHPAWLGLEVVVAFLYL